MTIKLVRSKGTLVQFGLIYRAKKLCPRGTTPTHGSNLLEGSLGPPPTNQSPAGSWAGPEPNSLHRPQPQLTRYSPGTG